MIGFLKRLRRNERGNVLVITAAAFPLLVGSAGLATDTIQWALWKRQLQRAADSAAMAGVYERVRASGGTANVPAVVTKDIAINQHTGIALVSTVTPTYPADLGALRNQVEVTLQVRKPLSFSSMFLDEAPLITASARAASVPGGFNPCVIGLEPTTSMGIQGSGNGTIETDCPWMTNSTGNKSAVAKGSSTIIASVMASAGAIEQSANFQVGRYDAYVPRIQDPYGTLDPLPSEMRCAVTRTVETVNVGTKKDPIYEDVVTITPLALTEATDLTTVKDANGNTPNCFSSLSVGSGGSINIPAAMSGPLFINGGSVNIQGTFNGASGADGGTALVMTNISTANNATIGSLDMNASGNLNITAPTTGKYAGIAILQDRRATDSGGNENNMPANSPNKINGNSSSRITGVVYFPNQQLTYNGNGDAAWACMRLVARRVQFSGNNRTRFSTSRTYCAGTGVSDIPGVPRVRLVG